MALPQRKDPDMEEPRRDYGPLPAERPVRATSAGFAWWWVLWLVIIGLFIWWAGWGWGGSGGWWWGSRRGNVGTATAAGSSGPGVQALNATDKASLINKAFQVNEAPVQDKVNNQALWIGPDNWNRMLAIPPCRYTLDSGAASGKCAPAVGA
jgi:hypothetical protein